MTDVKKLITEHLDIWLTAETEKKSGRGRSSGSSDSIYGVKKLRELILDLAVHGKLISQVDSKLDVRKLIENHIQEKRLNVKKPFIIDKTILPPHWVRVHLATIADHNTGKTLDKNRNTGSSRPYITTSNLYWGRFELNDLKEFLIEDSELERCQARKGDLLVIEGGDAGRSAIWSDEKPICFQNHIHRVRPFSGITSEYLYRCFEQFYLSGEIENYRQGVGIKSLSGKRLAQIPINLPPLEEQKRIVAKVDELMKLCDQLEQQQDLSSEVHNQLVDTLLNVLTNSSDADEFQENWQRISEKFDLLFTTEYSIEQLKQTILQLAVMGRLVKQDPHDEPASVLFKQITEEKARLIKGGEIKESKSLSEKDLYPNTFSHLPNNWILTNLCDLSVINPKNNIIDDSILVSFIPMTLIPREYSKKHEAETKTWAEVKKGFTHFAMNDIGVAKITPCFENSKACVFQNLTNNLGAGTTELHIVRPIVGLNSEYVLIYLKSPIFLKTGETYMTGTAGQKRLPKGFVEYFNFPLPPFNEQKRIVEKVNQLFFMLENLQTLQGKLQSTKLHLADSLVANAVNTSNDENKLVSRDNIVHFEKPIEAIKQLKQKSTDQIDLFTDESTNDDLKLLSLAAEITFQLHTEPTFGHLKLQKLIYLCQQLKHMDLAADFKQYAAGPYDRNIAKYIDTEFKKRQWFSYHQDETPKYKLLRKCGDHRTDFDRFFEKEAFGIYDLIGLFRTSKSDHIEIVATLFACWLRLLEKKLSVSEEQLLKDFYAWSKEKKRFSKAEVLNGYKWMKKNSVVPL